MEPDLPEMDEAGLRQIARIERAIGKLRVNDEGCFMSITNAIEFHLERYPPDPETIRLLAQALEAFAKSRGIDPRAAGFAKPLETLLRYDT